MAAFHFLNLPRRFLFPCLIRNQERVSLSVCFCVLCIMPFLRMHVESSSGDKHVFQIDSSQLRIAEIRRRNQLDGNQFLPSGIGGESEERRDMKSLLQDYKRQTFRWRWCLGEGLPSYWKVCVCVCAELKALWAGLGMCFCACLNQLLKFDDCSCWQAFKHLGCTWRACAFDGLAEYWAVIKSWGGVGGEREREAQGEKGIPGMIYTRLWNLRTEQAHLCAELFTKAAVEKGSG